MTSEELSRYRRVVGAIPATYICMCGQRYLLGLRILQITTLSVGNGECLFHYTYK